MRTRRFPALLLAAWSVVAVVMTVAFWRAAIDLRFNDTDDYMRLQQVRDFIAGQSWFDLTQHRVAPPGGLAMHWSRLVDIPILLFVVPLAPLIGQHLAESVALVGAPLLTLLVLMAAVGTVVRRLVARDTMTLLVGWLFAVIAPLVFAQIHPARIDHHGWQIALAAVTFAALLDARAARSGLIAGVASAMLLAISIEGAPFVVAALAALSVLWIAGRESSLRLVRFVQALALASLFANAGVAPAVRWSEVACDALMPGHLAALVVGALVTTLAVRVTGPRSAPWRFVALMIAAIMAFAALYLVAPQCAGSPYGTMDPLVGSVWFGNVKEGLPVWRQSALVAVSIIAFPVIGLVGAFASLRHARSPERQRRWLVTVAIGGLSLLTGAAVYRAGGTAQVIAIPGGLVLARAAMARFAGHRAILVRVFGQAAAILMISPIGPLIVVAALIPADDDIAKPAKYSCDIACAMTRLDARPATLMMNPIDLGPVLIARTRHSAYVASYHRIPAHLHNTIVFFTGSSPAAERFMRQNHLRTLIIAPAADETAVYIKRAPNGFAAQLAGGRIPGWLRRIDYGGGNALLLFEVVQP